MECEPTASLQPPMRDPALTGTTEEVSAAPSVEALDQRKVPLPVGSLARDVLGEEFVAQAAEERQRAVEQHRRQPRVQAARLAHARLMRQYFGL